METMSCTCTLFFASLSSHRLVNKVQNTHSVTHTHSRTHKTKKEKREKKVKLPNEIRDAHPRRTRMRGFFLHDYIIFSGRRREEWKWLKGRSLFRLRSLTPAFPKKWGDRKGKSVRRASKGLSTSGVLLTTNSRRNIIIINACKTGLSESREEIKSWPIV